jgi:RNA polymerase sigma-70 factor, ECF subfamily
VAERSDAELVRDARQGDEAAFEEMVHRFQRLLMSIGYAYLKDYEAAQDVAQEAFVSAFQRLVELKNPEQLRAWLGAVCRNRCLDVLRSQKAQREAERSESRVPPGTWLARTAGAGNLVDEIAFRERRELIARALAQLPGEFREVLILRGFKDLSYAEIAKITGVNEPLVKVRIFRARQMLAKIMEEEG